MHRLLLPCAGFLLAVLWMDLIFDVQVAPHPEGDLPREVLDSIATYYRRVTTDAAPMGHLVGVVMLATVGGSLTQLARGRSALWLRILPVLAAGLPIVLAQTVVFPNAVELGQLTGTAATQTALARSIYHAHLACLASILLFLATQLERGRGSTTPRR
jgi:hypothetical protein